MPAYIVTAPDGKKYRVNTPEGGTGEQAIAFLASQMPKEKEFAGFTGAFGEAASTLAAAPQAAAFAAKQDDASRRALLEATKSDYRHAAFGEGNNWEAFKEALGGTLGQWVAPAIAATGAGLLTGGQAAGATAATGVGAPAAPVAGLLGFIGAGGAAAFSTNALQYEIQGLARQAQEQQAAIDRGEKPNAVALGKSVVSAAASAGLDMFEPKIFRSLFKATPFARNILGQAGEGAAARSTAILTDAAEKGTLRTVGNITTGVGKGVAFEIPQEVTQQVLDRWQAGLSLTDEEAQAEYKQAAIGAAVVGGAFGGVNGIVESVSGGLTPEQELVKGNADLARALGNPDATPDQREAAVKARAEQVHRLYGVGALNPETAYEFADAERVKIEEELRRMSERGREAAPPPPPEPDANGQYGFDVGPEVPAPATERGPATSGTGPTPAPAPAPEQYGFDFSAGEPDVAGAGAGVPDTGVPGGVDTTVGEPEPAPAGGVGVPETAPEFPDVDQGAQPVALTPEEAKIAIRDVIKDYAPDFQAAGVTKIDPTQRAEAAQLLVDDPNLTPQDAVWKTLEKYGITAPEVEPLPVPEPASANPVELPVPETAGPEFVEPTAPEAAPAPVAAEPELAPTEPAPEAAPAPQVAPEPVVETAPAPQFTPESVAEEILNRQRAGQKLDDPVMAQYVNDNAAAVEQAKRQSLGRRNAINYDAKGTSVSHSISPQLEGVLRAWKDMLIPGVAVHFTTKEDLETANFAPEDAAIRAKFLRHFKKKPRTINAIWHRPDGSRVIALNKPIKNTKFLLETFAHEIGHIHQKEALERAPKHIQDAIEAEYQAWLAKTNGMSAKEHISALRAYETAQDSIKAAKYDQRDIPAKDMDNYTYFRSKDEWYADNVAKWAMSNKIPQTVVEKFFDKVGKALRRFYQTLKGQGYLPNETLAQFLNKTVNAAQVTAKPPRAKLSLKPKPDTGSLDSVMQAMDAEAEMNEGMAKARASGDRFDKESFEAGVEGVGEAIRGHDFENWDKALKGTKLGRDIISKGGLGGLPTDGMLDYAETLLGKEVVAPMRRAAENMDKLNASRGTYQRALHKIVSKVQNYVLSQGKDLLADVMHYARLNNVDMTQFKDGDTTAEMYARDGIWNKYNELLQEKGLAPAKKARYLDRRELREKQLRVASTAWGKLGQTAGGRAAYIAARNMYKDLYNVRRYLIEKHIKSMNLGRATEEKLLASYQLENEKLRELVKVPEDPEDAHADFPEVPLGLFHREYFPFKRYGRYSLRITGSSLGEPILRFYESIKERDRDWEKAAKEMGVSKNNSNHFEVGDDVEMDYSQQEALGGSQLFNEALNIIGSIDPEKMSETSKKQLQNDLYQLWLLGSPEGAVRKRFLKSKDRAGFSADVVRNIATSAEEYASDLSRLEFGPPIDRELAAAKDILTKEMGAQQAQLGNNFVNELKKRVQMEMMSPPKNTWSSKIVPLINRWAYLSFMTAPATALVNITALPIRVAPHLWGKYGMAATMKTMGKWNVFSQPRLQSEDSKGNKSFRIPTLGESPLVRSNPVFRRAYDWGLNMGLFEPMSAYTMHNEKTPTSAMENRKQQAARKAMDVMSYLFDASEQLIRESAFMSAFELEYKKLQGSGMTPEMREETAVRAAKEAVNYTLGNYTNFNRPRFMKDSEVAKAVSMFKQYAVIQTRFFFTASRSMFNGSLTKEERRAAQKEVTGVLAMSFLFGGVRALPLYTFGMVVLQLLQDLTDDDEDKRKRMQEDPLTAKSVEAQFKYNWLPEHFGSLKVPGAGKHQYSMADAILNGPLTEASGVDLGSRVSLDAIPMWWRTPKDSKNAVEWVNNALVANIPGASATLNIASMADEVGKGNVLKGLEVGLPAMVRSPLKAYRFDEEGVRTGVNKVKVGRDELSERDIIATALGLNPTIVARVQRQTRDWNNALDDIQKEKSSLLSDYNKAVRDYRQGVTGEEAPRAAIEAIGEFNQRTGNPAFTISYADIYASLRGAVGEEKHDIMGMGLNMAESYYVQKEMAQQ